MKPKKIIFISKFDGKATELIIQGEPKRWEEGRCWSIICENPIIYIHFSPKGYATHGYCNDTYESMKCHTMSRYEKLRGKWCMFVNGKLTEDKSWSRYEKTRLQKKKVMVQLGESYI